MQGRNEALKILGLPEEANRQQIESRYFHLVKKYKYLAHDEQPSPGEPLFVTINEAYRFLIGFVPMQKIQFRELNWRERINYIREYYIMEISIGLLIALFVFAAAIQIHSFSKVLQTGTNNSGITSTVGNPLPKSPCE
ncbi:MAG: hypothetical protein JWM44_2468 [Bacilli bacterium]|nr:hypothetical protein [Bacilli bacterium]